jgi:hypothetical protein
MLFFNPPVFDLPPSSEGGKRGVRLFYNGGDGFTRPDFCRRSDGIEFRECGDKLADAVRRETVECLDLLF